MAESRGQFESRLQAEGRFVEFGERVAYLKLRFVEDGLPKRDAGSKAWRQATLEFAAEEADPPSGGDVTEEIAPGTFDGKKCSEPEALKWVAEHLSGAVMPSAAPSAGAWSLRQWCRRSQANETTFWQSIYTKLLPTSRSAGSPGFKDDGEDDQRLLEMIDHCKQVAAEVAEASRLEAMKRDERLMKQIRDEVLAELEEPSIKDPGP